MGRKKIYFIEESKRSKAWMTNAGFKGETVFEPMYRFEGEPADSDGYQLHAGQFPYGGVEQAGQAILNASKQDEGFEKVAEYTYTPPTYTKK